MGYHSIFLVSACVLYFTCLTVAQNCGQFAFASYYGSSMVLQKAPARPRIWGYAIAINDQITVTISGVATVITTATAGSAGRPVWEATFDPIPLPGGPYTVTANDGACTLTMVDVLVGDVYVCSGQSNMQFRMIELDDPQPDIDDSVNYPQVRTFFASLQWSDVPLEDLIAVQQPWSPPVPNQIAQFSSLCWLFGRNLFRKLNYPIGLVESNWGGTRIEAWSSPDALSVCFPGGVPPGTPPNGASNLWNSMIHPLLPMPIFGAIWYQGESNTGNWADYCCAVTEMVGDWRSKWAARNPGMDTRFPFGQTQLAGWRNQDIVSGFPEIRWQGQTCGYGYNPNPVLQRHFLAVAIDLPDFASPSGDIHPRYKRQIADRMALGAFQVAYGQTDSGIYQGPIPTSYARSGGNVVITYDVPIQPVRSNSIYELCCAPSATTMCTTNGNSMWTVASYVQQTGQSVTIAVPCTGGQFVTGFRYLWRESPCTGLENCPIYSVENDLPAPPFVHHGLIV